MALAQRVPSGGEPPARQPLLDTPAIVPGLIGALALAHAGRENLSPESSADVLARFALIPARYSADFLAANGYDPGAWWERAAPFVTYMALHADYTHLVINCVWLLAFGPVVARRWGTPAFLAFFIICGVAGGLVHVALNWGSLNPVIGASGAISGLMGAALRMMPQGSLAGVFADQRPAALMPVFSRAILGASLVWIAVNLVAGLTGLGFGGTIHLIAWQAHLGGFLAGLFLATPFERFLNRRP